MDFAPPFGHWLKAQRARLDLTQGDLARRVGYSPETIRKIEAGVLKPSKQIVDLLADHLGVPSSKREAFFAFATDARTGKSQPALGNLPNPLTLLLGREKDVAVVVKLLKAKDLRLVTLLGLPGVGKTRLATEVAREIRDEFTHGAWFVALAPVTDPQAALATMLQALEAQPAPGLPPLDALKRHLRERELLLVLDNLEQVLDVAPLIAEVLSAAPKVKVLATSREPLRIAAEQRYIVQPLAADQAVALFVQRAKAVQPDFAPTAEVSAICAKLDGLPLAIELAAARVEAFTPKELLARLDKRLATLTSGGRDLPARQRTLRATIDWSYQLLTPDEQAFFGRMGVFAGGFTLHAAQTFCEIDGLPLGGEEGIVALLSKSLLVREQQGDGASRYRMLETIREFALDRLKERSEYDMWMENSGWYWVSTACIADALEPVEIANWQTAYAWASAHPHKEELCALLVYCADTYGVRPNELRQVLDDTLAKSELRQYPTLHVWLLMKLAVTCETLGDFRRSAYAASECLRISAMHDLRYIANVDFRLGLAARELGDLETARHHFYAGLRADTHSPDLSWRGDYLITAAEVEVAAEDAAAAVRLLDEGIPILREHGPAYMLGWALNHRAHAAILQSQFAEAKAFLAASDEIYKPNADFQWEWCLFWNAQSRGEIAVAQGNAVEAKIQLESSLRGFDGIGDKKGVAWCLATFAGAYALDEEPERGARLWGAGEGLRERIGCRIAPASRQNRERTVMLLHEQLSNERFEAEQAIGRAMTLEQAVAYALRTTNP
jgi:predicted ATPase/DNA-binding XRE family transcriptional regulator/tetratricopeptide (TPR) repeat protein